MVQKACTRWVPSLRDLGYEERLRKLKPPTLAERRKGGGMLVLHKYVQRIENIDINDAIQTSRLSLRGHSKMLYKNMLRKMCKGTVSQAELWTSGTRYQKLYKKILIVLNKIMTK